MAGQIGDTTTNGIDIRCEKRYTDGKLFTVHYEGDAGCTGLRKTMLLASMYHARNRSANIGSMDY